MGAWHSKRQGGSWGVYVLALAMLGCSESAQSGEQTSSGGTPNGAGSGPGGSGAGVAGSSGASIGGTSLGGSSGASTGGTSLGGSSGASTGGAGASAGASAGNGSGGAAPSCPTLPIGEEEGIFVTLNGEAVAFSQRIQFYSRLPPTLDISAVTDAEGWRGVRMFISPELPALVPGVYRSRPGHSYVELLAISETYEAREPDAAVICVSEAAEGVGARVSGTFTATLVSTDGTASLSASGTFLGTTVGPL